MMTRLLSRANRYLKMLSRYGKCRKHLLLIRVLVELVRVLVGLVHELVALHHMGVDFQAISQEAPLDGFVIQINVVCTLLLETVPDLFVE